ncbi:hypothetical protein [Mesobacterium pallidum]|uniref:hypothetical protein n=1 Tax=Mesobacterium pallidum TaxID=2872037 RepID=UPI001EE37927|nr:hypothetical protein [Mesobacterium pallidum]
MKESNGILWHQSGPRLELTRTTADPAYRYALRISDLNPEADITWSFSRWTMIRIGFWFIRRAVLARQS